MPITEEDGWDKTVANNQDPYGGACIKVARRVMEILDEEPGDFDVHAIICRADDEASADVAGFMAGYVASIVSHVHSRGDEFSLKRTV